MLAAGWGSGKSIGGLFLIAVNVIENPGKAGLVIYPTLRLLREFRDGLFKPAFKDFIAEESRLDYKFKMKNGATVQLISGHDLSLLEHYTVSWALVDEVCQYKPLLFTKITARTREQGAKLRRISYVGTPHWGWAEKTFNGRCDSSRRIIHASTFDNPFAPPEFIKELEASTPARLLDAMLHGQFVAPSGSVYPEFDEHRHVVDYTPQQYRVCVPVFDFSPRTPHCLIFQMINDGEDFQGEPLRKLEPAHQYAGLVLVDEIVPDGREGVTTERLATMAAERGWNFGDTFIADPAGEAIQATSGIDDIMVIKSVLGMKHRARRDPGGRSVHAGVNMVRRVIDPYDGIPRLYVARDVWERRHTKFVERRAFASAVRAYGYKGDPNNPDLLYSEIDKDGISDHAMDCLRYIVAWFFPSKRLSSHTMRSPTAFRTAA